MNFKDFPFTAVFKPSRILIALALAGCSASTDKHLAEKEVADFHDSFNEEAFDVMYASAGRHLKDVTAEKEFTSTLASLENSVGKVKRSTQTGWGVESNTTDGTVVSLKYRTVYERGDIDEEFQYLIHYKLAVLVHYKFQPANK
jgi:hypothetical protein